MAKICAVCGENLRSSSGENLCTLDYHLQRSGYEKTIIGGVCSNTMYCYFHI